MRVHPWSRILGLLWVGFGVFGVGLGSTALAAPGGGSVLTLLSADRTVAVSASSFCPGCGEMGEDTSFSQSASESSVLYDRFQHDLSAVGSGATHDSWVGSNRLSGEGGVSVGFSAFSDGSSSFRASFEVATASLWTLSGALSGNTFVEISISDGSGPVYELEHFGNPVDTAFLESIQLLPGVSYELLASVSAFGDGEGVGGTWQFELVPEPGSASLLAFGLVGLAVRRRVA